MYDTFSIDIPAAALQSTVKHCCQWADGFSHFAYFTSNDIQVLNGGFDQILFVGQIEVENQLNSLKDLQTKFPPNQWLYGHLGYNLKNEIENLESNNASTIDYNHIGFFQPLYVIQFENSNIIVHSWKANATQVWRQILDFSFKTVSQPPCKFILSPKTTYEEYVNKVKTITQHIVEGDIYELNYCIEFTAENVEDFNYLDFFEKLNTLSPMPFAVLYKTTEGIVMGASPERFLKREGNKLIVQPIKGTIARGVDEQSDLEQKQKLRNSPKEQAENMMIVDLTRNDLAKCSKIGSVKVDEMFGIYGFKNIYQMISTVSSTQRANTTFADIIAATFPMGSMTGAPKISAMQLIEKYEASNRGIYAGSIGMIAPNGDFDFNVVIRSLVYNPTSNKLSFHVGSAITYDSDPTKEYEECMLKAASMLKALEEF